MDMCGVSVDRPWIGKRLSSEKTRHKQGVLELLESAHVGAITSELRELFFCDIDKRAILECFRSVGGQTSMRICQRAWYHASSKNGASSCGP